jgi:hypothetical protein
MPATRKSPRARDVVPTEPRDEIITIVAAALARLIQADRAPAIPRPDTPASIAAVNLSESAEPGLELSGETRLSVPAG